MNRGDWSCACTRKKRKQEFDCFIRGRFCVSFDEDEIEVVFLVFSALINCTFPLFIPHMQSQIHCSGSHSPPQIVATICWEQSDFGGCSNTAAFAETFAVVRFFLLDSVCSFERKNTFLVVIRGRRTSWVGVSVD